MTLEVDLLVDDDGNTIIIKYDIFRGQARRHARTGSLLVLHSGGIGDSLSFFFEEAVLMMELPRRYSTPLEGGAGSHPGPRDAEVSIDAAQACCGR